MDTSQVSDMMAIAVYFCYFPLGKLSGSIGGSTPCLLHSPTGSPEHAVLTLPIQLRRLPARS